MLPKKCCPERGARVCCVHTDKQFSIDACHILSLQCKTLSLDCLSITFYFSILFGRFRSSLLSLRDWRTDASAVPTQFFGGCKIQSIFTEAAGLKIWVKVAHLFRIKQRKAFQLNAEFYSFIAK